jgi:hypothetical protein
MKYISAFKISTQDKKYKSIRKPDSFNFLYTFVLQLPAK